MSRSRSHKILASQPVVNTLSPDAGRTRSRFTEYPVPLAAVGGDGGDDGDPPMHVDVCDSCGAPRGRPRTIEIPAGVRTRFPLGPNRGVCIWRRVPGSDECLEIEYFPPDDEHDDFLLVEPLVGMKVAAITLGLTLPTLYARAPHMASSEKHGNRWFFKRDLLLTVDAAGEHPMPSRKEILAEREHRRAQGEVQRAASHHPTCDRRHAGRCAASRRTRPSERERSRARRSILDDLGK